jgi:hypothetical protein
MKLPGTKPFNIKPSGIKASRNWTRAIGLIALTGAALAQDAAPFRFTAALDSVNRYGGKSETSIASAFVFATDAKGSSKVPAGLKAAFERSAAGPAQLAGPSVSFTNSTETVHDVLEDGSRVVLIESVSQTTGVALGAAQRLGAEMTRTHKPDGTVLLEDVVVNVEGQFRPGNEEQNEMIRQGVALSIDASLRLQNQVLEACYKTTTGTAVPFLVDPKALQASGYEIDSEPTSLEPVRFGDLRLSRLPDGATECRISIDPQKYGKPTGPVRIISRQTMRFGSDGVLEHADVVSSFTYGQVRGEDFVFEGKPYRVRSILTSKSSGVSDRLR